MYSHCDSPIPVYTVPLKLSLDTLILCINVKFIMRGLDSSLDLREWRGGIVWRLGIRRWSIASQFCLLFFSRCEVDTGPLTWLFIAVFTAHYCCHLLVRCSSSLHCGKQFLHTMCNRPYVRCINLLSTASLLELCKQAQLAFCSMLHRINLRMSLPIWRMADWKNGEKGLRKEVALGLHSIYTLDRVCRNKSYIIILTVYCGTLVVVSVAGLSLAATSVLFGALSFVWTVWTQWETRPGTLQQSLPIILSHTVLLQIIVQV